MKKKFKLELQVNARRFSPTEGVTVSGIMITPPIDEDFWLFRVPVSKNQSVVGFPKFNVIGVGFQHEKDWNTNLPSGSDAVEIYEHIKRNSNGASRARCIEAILLIKNKVAEMKQAETIEKIKLVSDDNGRLDLIGDYLRKTGQYMVAEAFGR